MSLLLYLSCTVPPEKTAAELCTEAGYATVLTWYADGDGDGYGDASKSKQTCQPPDGWVLAAQDCDPNEAAINPAAPERCNDRDDDCDGATDEDFDLDQDGFTGLPCTGGDCDDSNGWVNPGIVDQCGDGVDSDCDGQELSCGVYRSLSDAESKIHSGRPAYQAGDVLDVGDANGDGRLDLLLSTLSAENLAGGAYLLPGPQGSSQTMEAAGYRLQGGERGAGAGRSMMVGDINGDGIEDVGIGSPFGENCAEWVMFGPLGTDRNLADADLVFTSTAEGFCGHGSDLVDANGDGVDDAVIGAYADGSGGFEAGVVFVKYGPVRGGTVDLKNEAEVKLVGETASSWTGRVVRGAPDLDGDGRGDLLISAVGATLGGPASGAVYVVYGAPTGVVDLADADGRLVGEAPSDYAGAAIGSGDINGDGLSDALVGAQSSTYALIAGAAYVVYGPASGDRSLSGADVIVRGEEGGQLVGGGVGSGEVDGQPGEELLVGAPGDGWGGEEAGAAYIF